MLRVLPVLAGFLLAAQAASAQDPGAFLKGQTVRFIVGYSPGGGYDAYARMLAPHFEKVAPRLQFLHVLAHPAPRYLAPAMMPHARRRTP